MLKKFISFVLSNPVLFNLIRGIIAGDQSNTKEFVRTKILEHNGKSILDIGCGTGDFEICVPTSCQYLGVDLDSDYIAYAQKHYQKKNHTFIVHDVTDKNFYESKKYDIVLFISMLHHLSDQELHIMLPVIKKITKNKILIADIIPNPSGILRKQMVKLDQGKYIRTKEEKLKLLKKYFKVVDSYEIPSRLAVQFAIICQP